MNKKNTKKLPIIFEGEPNRICRFKNKIDETKVSINSKSIFDTADKIMTTKRGWKSDSSGWTERRGIEIGKVDEEARRME